MNKGDIVIVETETHIHKFWVISDYNDVGISLTHPKGGTELFIPWRRVFLVTKSKDNQNGTQPTN